MRCCQIKKDFINQDEFEAAIQEQTALFRSIEKEDKDNFQATVASILEQNCEPKSLYVCNDCLADQPVQKTQALLNRRKEEMRTTLKPELDSQLDQAIRRLWKALRFLQKLSMSLEQKQLVRQEILRMNSNSSISQASKILHYRGCIEGIELKPGLLEAVSILCDGLDSDIQMFAENTNSAYQFAPPPQRAPEPLPAPAPKSESSFPKANNNHPPQPPQAEFSDIEDESNQIQERKPLQQKKQEQKGLGYLAQFCKDADQSKPLPINEKNTELLEECLNMDDDYALYGKRNPRQQKPPPRPQLELHRQQPEPRRPKEDSSLLKPEPLRSQKEPPKKQWPPKKHEAPASEKIGELDIAPIPTIHRNYAPSSHQEYQAASFREPPVAFVHPERNAHLQWDLPNNEQYDAFASIRRSSSSVGSEPPGKMSVDFQEQSASLRNDEPRSPAETHLNLGKAPGQRQNGSLPAAGHPHGKDQYTSAEYRQDRAGKKPDASFDFEDEEFEEQEDPSPHPYAHHHNAAASLKEKSANHHADERESGELPSSNRSRPVEEPIEVPFGCSIDELDEDTRRAYERQQVERESSGKNKGSSSYEGGGHRYHEHHEPRDHQKAPENSSRIIQEEQESRKKDDRPAPADFKKPTANSPTFLGMFNSNSGFEEPRPHLGQRRSRPDHDHSERRTSSLGDYRSSKDTEGPRPQKYGRGSRDRDHDRYRHQSSSSGSHKYQKTSNDRKHRGRR